MKADVAVLVLSTRIFESSNYFLHLMMDEWRVKGLRVKAFDDPTAPPAARVIFNHVDATAVPSSHLGLPGHSPIVNARTGAVNKRATSTVQVRPGDGYRGPVVVKTDLNHGGFPELYLSSKRSWLHYLQAKALRILPWTVTGLLVPSNYKIYDGPDQVPRLVWRNPRLVIERFVPERLGARYCVREHLFLGDRDRNYMLASENPIVKVKKAVEYRPIDRAPEEILALRRSLGLDYGRIDYVVHERTVVPLDVNRTPGASPEITLIPYQDMARDLARGIEAFLPGSA